MKCPNCGRENEDGAKFCKGCGERLQITNAQTNSTSGTKSNNNTLIIAIAAIICVCIIAGAFVLMSGNNSTDDNVAVSDSDADNSTSEVSEDDSSSSNDNDRYADFDANEWSESSYTLDEIYTAHTPDDVKAEMFNKADANGNGVLTGNEIKEMDYLLKHSEYTYNGPSSEKHWYGQCTTHGWVQLDSNQHCPYCIEEGLDPRVLKDSKVYQ